MIECFSIARRKKGFWKGLSFTEFSLTAGLGVFGEEYGLAVDDQGLTRVLEAHRALIGDARPVTQPVTDIEGHTRIVDLMLSKASFNADSRKHLVVALKRPSLKLSLTELNQITNYAMAVSKDERFKSADVAWDFWLLGDDMDGAVEELANQCNQPSGLYAARGNYQIWVRRWAEILEENRQRLHFFRDHLGYLPGEQEELEGMLGNISPRLAMEDPAILRIQLFARHRSRSSRCHPGGHATSLLAQCRNCLFTVPHSPSAHISAGPQNRRATWPCRRQPGG